jgi:hypothetical protein
MASGKLGPDGHLFIKTERDLLGRITSAELVKGDGPPEK